MAVLPYSLWDFSAVEKFTASVDELRELGLVMREVATHGREGRFTALAAPQPLIFGQLRQFEVFVGAPEDRRVEFRVVSSRADAETWINERMTAADGPDSAPFETAG